jgi:transglutaminase-like putative cysteine protease
MRLRIHHRTVYTYDREVVLEPHTIRLHPRGDAVQRVIDYHIEIHPRPVLMTACLDAEGNSVSQAWFEGAAASLAISTWSETETLRSNPFDYLITDPGVASLPARYAGELQRRLEAYVAAGDSGPAVREFAGGVAAAAGGDTLRFLAALNDAIYRAHRHELRPEGEPQAASQTLARGVGACRDLTVLFVECCRAFGLAARFVSGYQLVDDPQERREMHAWAEVYLPGGGWRAYDPSHGLAVSDRLVAVAAGATHQDAAPVTGTFRGPGGAHRKLEYEIEIGQTTCP